MIGHSGSSSAHPTVLKLCDELKHSLPKLLVVYGGVYPSYHWDEILQECPAIDIIVRGEGEQTSVMLMEAISSNMSLENVRGVTLA
jgi:anaerobic magnesium-protoporphyrin IX monomethyl ester cyclase